MRRSSYPHPTNRNGYVLEFGPRDYVFARRVYWGRGTALYNATRRGAKLAKRMGEVRFYVTDIVSAKTTVYSTEDFLNA